MSIWNDNNMACLVLQPKYAAKDQLRKDCLVPIQKASLASYFEEGLNKEYCLRKFELHHFDDGQYFTRI